MPIPSPRIKAIIGSFGTFKTPSSLRLIQLPAGTLILSYDLLVFSVILEFLILNKVCGWLKYTPRYGIIHLDYMFRNSIIIKSKNKPVKRQIKQAI